MIKLNEISLLTYIYNIIIKEQPEAVTFDDADVMPSVWSAPTMHHHSYQVVHTVRITRVIRLKLIKDKHEYHNCFLLYYFDAFLISSKHHLKFMSDHNMSRWETQGKRLRKR